MKQERAHQASVRDCTADELLAAARFGIPGIRSSHVRRPRLVAALTEAPELPLVLVSGPAGTGKTALVAEWVRETQEIGTTGWVTFEDGDDDFWGHLLECLRRLGLDTSALGEGAPADTATTLVAPRRSSQSPRGVCAIRTTASSHEGQRRMAPSSMA